MYIWVIYNKVIIKEIRVINKTFSKLEIITNDNKENYHIKYIENKLLDLFKKILSN